MAGILDEGAARFATAQDEGRRLVSRRWTRLQSSTRSALTDSGFYTVRGARVSDDDAAGSHLDGDWERLEYALGVLAHCVASVLPSRAEKGAQIPSAALDPEVLSSCEELLSVPGWHDPEFLRLALAAAVTNQEANALTRVGPPKSPSAALSCIGRLFQLGLVLLIPAALALGLAAASGRDAASAALGFYLLGAGILAATSVRKKASAPTEANERDYLAWSLFRLTRATGVTGAGASVHLYQMALAGTNVPSALHDVASTLQARMTEPRRQRP
jgi:hypothetical protein